MIHRYYAFAGDDPELAAAILPPMPWLGLLFALLFISAVFMRAEQ